VGSWGPCSATCGVGIQTREVHCLSLAGSPPPPEACRQGKPHALQACNQFDCPPGWHIEDWQQVWHAGGPVARHACDGEEFCFALTQSNCIQASPALVFLVLQDLWWGSPEPTSHLSAAVDGWQLLEPLR
jgi:hypothetical protein